MSNGNITIFGREPAVIGGVLTAAILLLSLYLGLSDNLQGALNAVVTAGVAFFIAYRVGLANDGGLIAVVGLAKAVLSLFLAFGTPMPASTQAAWIGFISIAASAYLRTQVSAPQASPNPVLNK